MTTDKWLSFPTAFLGTELGEGTFPITKNGVGLLLEIITTLGGGGGTSELLLEESPLVGRL